MNEQPHFFADINLARRLERAEGVANAKFVEARAKVAPKKGSCWIEVAGTYAMYDGPESPTTQTFGLGMFEEIRTPDLERIERFYEERGSSVFHEVSPLAGVPAMALLNERNYRPIEFTSVMWRPTSGGVGLPCNEKIRVRPIRDGEQKVWVQTVVQGWSHIPELKEFLEDLAPVNAARESAVSFLAELDGRAIAAAALCVHEGVGLLAGACTIPEARKQGAQLALLDARLRHAREHGCDVAMICAQPGSASQRNAERHGFRIAYTRTKWQREAGGQA